MRRLPGCLHLPPPALRAGPPSSQETEMTASRVPLGPWVWCFQWQRRELDRY